MIVEMIAASVDDAIKIEQGGADRIELVTGLSEGGLTPSYGLICGVRAAVNIPIMVMIRPHAGNFNYSPTAIEVMTEDIVTARLAGADGIVLGCLDEKGYLDKDNLSKLIELAVGLDITFHRALDSAVDYNQTWCELQQVDGLTRILTAGGKGGVDDNVKQLQTIAKDKNKKLKTIIGSGLNVKNCLELFLESKADEVHFGTAIRKDFSVLEAVDGGKVAEIVDALRGKNHC